MVLLKIANVILPVFMVIAVGFLIGRLTKFDVHAPTTLSLYVFGPAFFFTSMVNSDLEPAKLGLIVLFVVTLFGIFAMLTHVIAKVFKYNREHKNALMLASAFPNAGNYAVPLLLFAFGDAGLAIGVVFMVVSSLIISTAGVFYASQSESGFKEALLNILRIPGFTAVILGMIIKLSGFELPMLINRPVEILGNAQIPTVLVLLGVSLSQVKLNKAIQFVSLATVMKLIIYPLLAFALTHLFFPANSLEAKVLTLSSATPTAATTTILAMKYNAKPELVSTAMFVTTVLSLVTVSTVLVFLL